MLLRSSQLLRAASRAIEHRDTVWSYREWNCYGFANQVLRLSLLPQALQEWDGLWQKTLHFLPDSHWAPEIIPYHYFLIANFLKETTASYKYWSCADIFEVKKGDIFIYEGDYEHDPAKRSSSKAPDSHIAFVDEVLEAGEMKIVLQLIDVSERMKGRCFDLRKGGVPEKPGCIAYSFLTLNLWKELEGESIWKTQFKNQSPKYLKIRILRLLEESPIRIPAQACVE